MRRSTSALALFLVLAGGWPGTPTALAQPQPSVVMRLVAQSAWNGPRRNLQLTFDATNTSSAPLEDLSVVLSIQAPARSRSEYALSLRSDATSLLSASLFPQKGALPPGQARVFKLRESLEVLTQRGESVIYPLKVELLSGDTPVGTLRTPMIFLIEPPKIGLNLQWTWVFSAPVEYRPDGVFVPGTLERSIAQDGRLTAMAKAIAGARPFPVDIVMSSVLADELGRLRGGYRVLDPGGAVRSVPKGTGAAADADRLLATLAAIARRPATELMAFPFGDPSLPALVQSGSLNRDLSGLLQRGRSLVKARLGVAPTPSIVRPPFSQLDVQATNRLRSLGARALLLDPGFLTPPGTPSQFTTAPVVQLVGARKPIAAVVPDSGVLDRALAYPMDPILSAHAALGELAAIWFEFPGRPNRGTSILFGESSSIDPRFFSIFTALVGDSPWLHPISATGLVALIPDREDRPIPARNYAGFNPVYVSHLLFTRTSLTQFERTAIGAKPLVDRLQTVLLLAEGGSFVSDPVRGRLFIDSAYAAILQTYRRIAVSPGLVTLTSRQGSIPVTLRNQTGYTIRVRIVLIADRRVTFVKGDSLNVTLPPAQRTLLFAVRAETTGRFPVKVQIKTPVESGAQTITETEVLVRSTAYNRIALLLTVGAALFLLGWWGRRFLPRRRS